MLSLLLMVGDKHVAAVSKLRAALSIPLVPLQYLVSGPIQFIDNLKNLVSTHDSLVKDNLDLKAQQLLLKAEIQRMMAVESENNQLKALLSSKEHVNGKVLVAQLLAVDSEPFVNQVIIDKGTEDGVFIGQPVLDANGVMGQVMQVSAVTSRILLINDVHSGISVADTRTGIRAIAIGDNTSGKLRLLNVPQTVDMKVGDVLVTSGLGDRYPAGYPVGSITTLSKDTAQQFATIAVEPSAHLDRSRQVLLIWPNKNQSGGKA